MSDIEVKNKLEANVKAFSIVRTPKRSKRTAAKKVLAIAVSTIYFSEGNCEFANAWWAVIQHLGGDEAVALMENEPAVGFAKYVEE